MAFILYMYKARIICKAEEVYFSLNPHKTPNQLTKQKRWNSCQVDHKYNGEILLFRSQMQVISLIIWFVSYSMINIEELWLDR